MGDASVDAPAGFDGTDWGATYQRMAELASARRLDPDESDRLAIAAYLTGRDEESFELWARAHQERAAAGDPVGAARFGARVGYGLGFKGDIGRARGWVERCRHLLEDAGIDCVELGYIDHADGLFRLFEAGDVGAAHAGASRAVKVADRFRDRELRTLARITEGRCLIYLGEIAEGVALLDEAMVSVEAREVSPISVGDAYCTVIDACHELLDVRRCDAWVESFQSWCDAQPGLVLYRGHCLLHRAEMLQLHGDWATAAAAAQDACARLAAPVHPSTLGGAHYVEGELLRLRGRFDDAEVAYQRASELGCEPQPGLALLRAAQGRLDGAAAGIRRALAETEGPIARSRMLDACVEIGLAAGDLDAATAAATELHAVAGTLGSPLLRAHAERATGALRLATGDATGALASLRRACRGLADLDVPYEVARTRVLIADACESVGDRDGAELERRAARASFEALGAAHEVVRMVDAAAPDAPQLPGGLSAREAEVLALVAQGKTNRVIASELFISEKTVASHLSHIFTTLGLTSRAAATAYAYEHGIR